MFTKEEFKQVRSEIESELAAFCEKYGLEIEVGRINYSETDFTASVKFKKEMIDGKSHQEHSFRQLCFSYGFEINDYRREVSLKGKTFRFVGFNPRARKNHCLIEDENGTQYSTTIEGVKNNFI